MAKNIVIVESPAKTKTLARFLGKGYDILATVGHVVDLPKSKIGVDPDDDFRIDYQVIKGKEKVIAQLKKAAKKAETVFLAPDPDREGEAIAWHVANSLRSGSKATFKRVTFNEITESAVQEAINNPREIDMNLVNAQQTRRVLDRVVGYMVSPFLWKTITHNLSAGRVQSVALRLICEREAEIDKFEPQEYWQIAALLKPGRKAAFTARLVRIDEKTVVAATESGPKKMSITSEKEVKGYLKELNKSEFSVSSIKETVKQRRPVAPFITSTLQQEAAKVHGFAPRRTMSIAQKLYEGIEVGKKGSVGLITYMRTDSTRVSQQAIKQVRKHIKDEYGGSYLPAKANFYGKKKGAQDAHEAIRPTYLDLPPDRVKKDLTPQQWKLYALIWKRFVASQMTPAQFDILTIDIEAGRFMFRATSQQVKFDGFLRVYNEAKDPTENGNGNGNGAVELPSLKENDKLTLKELTPNQSFTKPPPRFSEAMLVKRLEADGIGRPSTYASIISTLRDRRYVESNVGKLAPTDLGVTVSKILVENFPKLFNVKFTATMEGELDLIEEGTDDWVKVLSEFYQPFKKTLDALKGKEKAIKASMVEKTDEKCPKCSSPMVIKWGRNGRFLACSAYPECKSTKPLPEEEAQMKTTEVCEKCGEPMVVKVGRFGRFLACSGYPDCKTTKAITLGIKCPKDGCTGDLVERRTRGGKVFFGCSKYPKCDFASWDRPVNQKCPSCDSPFMYHKISKRKGEFYRCPDCKAEMPIETTESAEVTG